MSKKKMSIFVLKAIVAVPLTLLGLWLLQMLYLPGVVAHKSAALQEPAKEEGIFAGILRAHKPLGRGHFHIIDEEREKHEPYEPLCLTCHGTFPHSKEKKVRSLLNFHTGFMACAVCHVRKDPGDQDHFFIWVDRVTGITSLSVEGEYGKYPAKIFPVRITGNNQQEIIRPVSQQSALEYLELKDKFTPDQAAKAKIKLHEKLSQKPVFCMDCHKKDGYIEFSKLGYPRNRVDHLASTEVASMIEKYETFYLPEVIDFSGN
ncbi:MAG: hypothetical protein JRH12_18135 [Deltaproteobacteria bacterium]|jgi:cytochrome c553|nr:hypothetical protein [Deltaproteobacteria bacterium]